MPNPNGKTSSHFFSEGGFSLLGNLILEKEKRRRKRPFHLKTIPAKIMLKTIPGSFGPHCSATSVCFEQSEWLISYAWKILSMATHQCHACGFCFRFRTVYYIQQPGQDGLIFSFSKQAITYGYSLRTWFIVLFS